MSIAYFTYFSHAMQHGPMPYFSTQTRRPPCNRQPGANFFPGGALSRMSKNLRFGSNLPVFDVYAIHARIPASRQLATTGCSMEMAYRDRWQAEIAELQKILSAFPLREECKWGKPCYTVNGKNVVIIQGFKEYCALGFFQGALLKDPEKLLVQLGQVQAGRVMKFTSAREIAAKTATIKAYVREAMAAAKAGVKVATKPREFPVPEELEEKFRKDPRFKRAFEALTPGRQRGYLFHFAGAKPSE